MQPLSTIVFNPDTASELEELMRQITPLLHATRDDRIETRTLTRPAPDGDEVTLYVIVHTGNILGMIADLSDHDLI